MDEKISRLKDRLHKNQEDWAISFKELEYQQPVLVTSGVLENAVSYYLHLLFHYDVILPYLVKRTRKYETVIHCSVPV